MPNSKHSLHKLVKLSIPQSKIELSPKQVERLRNVGEITLSALAVAGVMVASAIAPNVLQLLKYAPWERKTYSSNFRKRSDQTETIARSFYYLKRQNYITLAAKGSDWEVKITEKGRRKLRRMNFNNLIIPKPELWDKSWWLVLADIPSKDYRSQADSFRRKLKLLGFYPLQRTAWLYPFDPRDEIDFVSAHYNINPFVTVMQVRHFSEEDKNRILKHFKKTDLI